MEQRGSEVPKVIERWIHFVNRDGSGEDIFINPRSIESVTVRMNPSMELRIATAGKTIDVENGPAEQLLHWLERISGLIIEARL